MSNRTIRVGELLLRELSGILHSKWRSESVGITLAQVDVAPDLRSARIYYSAIGGRENIATAGRFLAKIKKELKALMIKHITLKYTPNLEFVYDHSFERGSRIVDIMEALERGESGDLPNAPSYDGFDFADSDEDCDNEDEKEDDSNGTQHGLDEDEGVADFEGDEPSEAVVAPLKPRKKQSKKPKHKEHFNAFDESD